MTQSLFDSVLPTQPTSSFPLSYAQRQLWFLEQLAQNGAGYNIPNAYHLQGNLQIAALERSFAALLQRHQVLCTYFIDIEGQPQQVITAIAEPVIPVIDLQHLPSALREAEARKIAEAEAIRPFDLACPPLWRISLLQIDRAEYWLLFTVHHTIFDGWSCDIFADELLTLYKATVLNQDNALPELPMQYTDFVQWQQQQLQGEGLERLLDHWKHILTPIPQPLELPTDFPRPPQPSYRGTRMGIQLSASLTARLRVLSQQQQATLYMTLLAAFKVLLFRYTAQSDIAIGTPIANRLRPEFAGLIGFLVNTLVLRTDINSQQSFLELLAQVRKTALAAYEHAELPFDVLVEALRPERDLSYNPLFQVMFQLHNQAPSLPSVPGLRCSPLTINSHTASFDLTLEMQETDDGMMAEMEYSTDLFLPETVQRMLDHYAVLLEGIVANPQQPIAELPLLTLAERNQLFQGRGVQVSDNAAKVFQVQDAQSPLHQTADLALTLTSTEAGLIGELVHAADRSKTAAIATILEEFAQQLRHLALNPDDVPPTHLNLQLERTDVPVAQVQISWPSRGSSHAQDSGQQQAAIQCLHQYFEDQVRRTPDHVALYHRDQRLTYAELNAKANQIAHLLVKWGVQPDMPVGVCFERSLDMIVALFAVLKAGGAYLPLDPSYPQERLEYMIEDAQVSVVLTQQGLRSRLPATVQRVLCLDTDDVSAEFAHVTQPLDNPAVSVEPYHLAYIIYTSGSTGKPKGVMIEHQAVAHFIKAAIARFQITDADCVLQFASISFDAAVEEIFTSLTTGASLYLRDEDMLGAPSSFLQACQERNITVLDLPTAYWHQLVTEIAANRAQLPPAVRLVIIGGERALPSLVKTWQQRVGDYPQLINTYGPTETTVTATSFQITQSANIRQEVPIGQPLANAEAYVLDEHRQPLPIGIAGELHIGGDSLARGYLHRPELTQEKFIPHPFSPKSNAKLYKTGDLVRYLADGNIEFLGRIDNQIKIRGFRVELGEIEAALLEYPGVRETIVVAQADNLGSQQLVAYVVEYADQPISKPALRSFLQQSLPNYMVPAAVVSLDALPLTPNGKVDRRALPAPTFATEAAEDATFVAPRTPLEQMLATIWAETLKLPQVSVTDSFFELGGHSLQGVQMITRMMTELNVNPTLSSLFQAPTVEEMAHRLAAEGAEVAWSPLVTFQANGSKPPFFAVHGGHGEVLFYRKLAQYLGDDQPFYALRARGNDYPDLAHQQVEEMAACYIEAIRSVQPDGPYRIGGASLGGIVAFEMAQQLHAAGQTVEQLVVFDTGGFDDYIEPLPLHQRAINVLRYLPKYGVAETGKRLKIRLLKLFNNDSIVEFYRANGTMPDPNSPEIVVWEKIWYTNLAALENYSPQVYPGKLTLLRAVDDGDYMWNRYQADYGWGRYAAQGVDSYDVSGNHVGMFQEPHVQQLAQCLQQLLDTSF